MLGPVAGTASAQTTPPNAAPPATVTALPEIGRTRSRPLCTALREIVAPAILSTQRADAQFSEARPLVFDAIAGDAAGKAMLMRRIDRAMLAMAREVMTLKGMLDDPRLGAPNATDASAGDEKARADLKQAVRVLYESESRQLNALNGFLENGRRDDLKTDSEDILNLKSALDGMTPPPVGGQIAGQEKYLGAPPRYTNKLAEAHDVDRWVGRVVAVTTKREEAASSVIVAAAGLCR